MDHKPKAVIDIGTNTVLMLVGRRRLDGRVDVLRDDAIITRLGRGADASGRLDPAAIDATLHALRAHLDRARADSVDSIVAVATESLRMADNREAFLVPATALLGAPIRLLSGAEEAALSYASVAQEEPAGPLRVIDIGGGSTELVVGNGPSIESARSHRIGSVRFTERFVQHDPPGIHGVARMMAAASEALATQPMAAHPTLHGLAGTATTTAAMLLGLQEYDRDVVDGSRFDRDRVVGLRDALAREPEALRAKRPCLSTGRADVIVAGLTILVAALDHVGARTLVVRDRGVRYALL